ncbi:hypothetical protein ACV1DN_18970 [Aeromonas allosaccharophila]
MLYPIITLLASSPFHIGIISYACVLLLSLFNIFLDGIRVAYLIPIILVNVYLISSGHDIDFVVINVLLHCFCLLTFVNKNRLMLLRDTLCLIIIANVFLFLYSKLFNYDVFFVSSIAKGIEDGIPLYRGIYSTPQLLASMCLIYWVVLYSTIKNANKFHLSVVLPLSIFLCLMSFNRTILGGSILIFGMGYIFNRSPRFFFLFLLLCIVAIPLIFELITTVNIETVNSRLYLSGFVWDTIDKYDVCKLLFGDQSVFSTEVKVVNYFVLNNIENGFLFLFRFFGLCGLFFYTLCIVLFMYKSYVKNRDFVYVCFILFYFVFVQLITQEFVSINFYISVLAVLSITKVSGAKNEKNSVFSSGR